MSGVDGFESRFIPSSYPLSWLELVPIVSSFSSSFILLVWVSFRGDFFTVKEDDLFFLVFLIVCIFALVVCSPLSLSVLSSYSAVPKSPFNSTSLSGSSIFSVVLFSWLSLYSPLAFFCSPLFFLTRLHLVLCFYYWVSSCD